MNATTPARILGIATAAYGAAVTVRPAILLRPSGLGTGAEPELRTLARSVALRDVLSGIALAAAAGPRARAVAALVRVGSDVADTVVFGHALKGRPERGKTLAVTSGWGLLCLAAAVYEHRRSIPVITRGAGRP
ncbi:hypothetical protein [Nocardia mangyaensis]|uniref:hypothetical protein n=1 Tax=Nocardia mangyaensis TaxID=2213200 RepID=UPI0026763979|nr:hypothetical protein [Nocardia mangyaensis]MDO3646194.1 hypothetical protein [Nocardia mangyaensis]